nr:MAG TPA: hypothetical protein [Caudoviricetes sp.]
MSFQSKLTSRIGIISAKEIWKVGDSIIRVEVYT